MHRAVLRSPVVRGPTDGGVYLADADGTTLGRDRYMSGDRRRYLSTADRAAAKSRVLSGGVPDTVWFIQAEGVGDLFEGPRE